MYFSTPNFVFAKFAHFIIMNRLSATIAATSIKQSKVSKKKVTLKHYGVKLKAVKKKKRSNLTIGRFMQNKVPTIL